MGTSAHWEGGGSQKSNQTQTMAAITPPSESLFRTELKLPPPTLDLPSGVQDWVEASCPGPGTSSVHREVGLSKTNQTEEGRVHHITPLLLTVD